MKVIAFDFDGTLVNNWLLTVDSAQAAAETSRINLTATDIKILRQNGWVKFIRLAKWPLLKGILFLGLFIRKVLKQESNLLQIPPAIVQLLLELFAAGNIICVVSSSRTDTIKSVLKRHNLLHAVREIHGNQLIWSKHIKLIELKKEYDNAKNYYYIGDEVRDAVAATKAGYIPIAAAWGYQDESLLKQEFTKIARNPVELRAMIDDTL